MIRPTDIWKLFLACLHQPFDAYDKHPGPSRLWKRREQAALGHAARGTSDQAGRTLSDGKSLKLRLQFQAHDPGGHRRIPDYSWGAETAACVRKVCHCAASRRTSIGGTGFFWSRIWCVSGFSPFFMVLEFLLRAHLTSLRSCPASRKALSWSRVQYCVMYRAAAS